MTTLSVPSQQRTPVNQLEWSKAAELPVKLGLAGVFTGISHDVMLIAGGTNFPGLKPWEGGKKAHYNEVFVLQKTRSHEFRWLPSHITLKNRTAYGASVSVGNKIVCVGGETDTANCSSDAFVMQWDDTKQSVVINELPSLPTPVANACMTAIGSKVYLIGGECNGKPTSRVYTLDLALLHSQWQLLPELPLALSHAVAVTQSNGNHLCVYVIGGRSSTSSGVSKLHHTAFCFDPEKRCWTELAAVSDGSYISNWSAGTGIPIGRHGILLTGGDNGIIFHQIESYNAQIAKTTGKLQHRLQKEKLDLVLHHNGFSRKVLLYNTVTNKWKKVQTLPFLAQVTTTAVLWDNYIYIPGGEIHPGVRTSDIWRGRLQTFD